MARRSLMSRVILAKPSGTPDQIDDHVRPERLTPLAHPPAVVLEAAGLQGQGQRPLRFACLGFSRGIEQGKVAAEHLGFGVVLEALGPGVPAADPAIETEPVDRIVGDALDQPAIKAVGQLRCGLSIGFGPKEAQV